MKFRRIGTLLVLTAAATVLLCGCQTKTLHCDYCGAEVVVSADSNMEEDWTIYCETCNEELFGDDPLFNDDSTPYDQMK